MDPKLLFNGNVQPGLLVEEGVTSANKQLMDFYLQSHQALQGSARSAPLHGALQRNEERRQVPTPCGKPTPQSPITFLNTILTRSNTSRHTPSATITPAPQKASPTAHPPTTPTASATAATITCDPGWVTACLSPATLRGMEKATMLLEPAKRRIFRMMSSGICGIWRAGMALLLLQHLLETIPGILLWIMSCFISSLFFFFFFVLTEAQLAYVRTIQVCLIWSSYLFPVCLCSFLFAR